MTPFLLGVPVPPSWTVWDAIQFQFGDITIKKFVSYFKKTYGVNVSVISTGNHTLYRSYDQNKTEVQNMKMSERYLKVVDLPSLPSYLDRIDLTLNAKVVENKKVANLPIVRFFFNKKSKTAKKRKVDKEDK